MPGKINIVNHLLHLHVLDQINSGFFLSVIISVYTSIQWIYMNSLRLTIVLNITTLWLYQFNSETLGYRIKLA